MSFSVVIPLFNKEKTISRALESVLNQSRPADQVVVVDDGSTDSSLKQAGRFEFLGVTVISQKNMGESAARNRGIQASTCDFIAFLDADDYWLPNHLNVLESMIDEYPQAVMLGTRSTFSIEPGISQSVELPDKDLRQRSGQFLSFYARDYSIINSSTACVHREKILGIRGFPTNVRRGADVITWLRLGEIGICALSESTTAVIDRGASDRVSSEPMDSLPGSLVFIADQMANKKFPKAKRKLYRRLNSKIVVNSAGVARIEGRSADVALLAKEARTNRSVIALFCILAMGIAPKFLLRFARDKRPRNGSWS